jgi:hypothetical protein
MSWVKLEAPPAAARSVKVAPSAPVFSAGEGESAFTLVAPGPLSRWQHLTAVLHHGRMTIYVDGKETTEATVDAKNADATIRLGSLGKKQFLSGLMDEVRIYDRALSPAEIATIYQREKPKAAARTASQ